MQKSNRGPGEWGHLVFSVVASSVIVVDQLSKAWIRGHLAVNESIPITSFFRISHIRNTGAAFGLFSDQSTVLAFVSLMGVLVMLVLAFVMHRRFVFLSSTLGRVTLGLVFGGTVGNLLDRLRFDYVTDFVDFDFWPTFNIADSSVVVGIIILTYSFLFLNPKEQRESEG